MSNFNQSFYTPATHYTREMAEARLIEKGYSDLRYTGLSYANGASFYFEDSKGNEIRVSDHRLTGHRAFGTIQVDIVERKTMGVGSNK